MRFSRRIVLGLGLTAALAWPVAGAVPAAAAAAGTPLPAHVYAPYFETWTTDSISTIAQQSGARYFTRLHPDAQEGVLHSNLERRCHPDHGVRPVPRGHRRAALGRR